MRKLWRTLGWIFTALAAFLVVLGLFSLPAGGLMFALPFVFFLPGAFLGALGGGLLFLTRAKVR